MQPRGRAPWVITADHAGRAIPRALGTLGVGAADLERHIAWDIGIAGLTERLAVRLDAFAILQQYSRLVIDCNRTPGTPQSIATESERTPIPGNVGITAADAQARAAAIFHPYHDRIRAELDTRAASGRPAVLVALHSFTPVFLGNRDPGTAGFSITAMPASGICCSNAPGANPAWWWATTSPMRYPTPPITAFPCTASGAASPTSSWRFARI